MDISSGTCLQRFGIGLACYALIAIIAMQCSYDKSVRPALRPTVYLSHAGIMSKQENYAIAKMTARCAQYMSALKIVCKRKISRRLRKSLHITILSLFRGEIIFEVFHPM